MIIEAILNVVVNVVEWIAGIFPTFGLDLSEVDMSGLWEALGEGAAALDGWVPVNESLAAASVLLTLQVAVTGWGFVVWLYHQFWGSS